MVAAYIETAQPVGSGHVAQCARGRRCRRPRSATTWPCSSRRATSTSPTPAPGASRPTRATGSSSTRLGSGASLDAADSQQVRAFFAEAHGELEQMLADTSRLLSDLTHYAAVVVGPAARGGHRPLGAARRAGARASRCWWSCSPTARSTSTPSSSPHDVDDATLAAAGARLAQRLIGLQSLAAAGRALAELAVRPPSGATRTSTSSCARLLGVLVDATRRGRSGLRRRHVADGLGVRRGRHRERGAADPRAAVRRGHPAARRPRPGPPGRHRHRDRHGARWPTARSSCPPTRSTASWPAPSACSVRPA